MTTTQLITADTFAAMPDAPGRQYELVRGEVVEMPGAAYVHAQILKRFFRLLDAFAEQQQLGEVYGDGLSYVTRRNPDSVRIPDLSFIARDRLPADGLPTYVPFPPDLAVEIVSPSDRAIEVSEKVQEYLACGVRLVWVLWPNNRTVHVHAPDADTITVLGPEDELDGGDVLPGFRVLVAELFNVRTQR